ncbi:MAG: ExeA family protein [Candidatus Krumholzibacteriia bacterium]
MYESFYHLKEQPFGSTPDPRYLYKSIGHRQALAYLAYGVFRKKGFLAVTGEVGIGKTTVIRAFVNAFHPCLDVSFVLNTTVGFEDMLYLILQDFGCKIDNSSKVGMLSTLNRYLIEKFAENRNPLIIIDESQNLSGEVLEELRMLSNLETDRCKLLQIVLVGQTELLGILNRRELRQLKQRIPGILRMKNLQPGEVGEYIRYRLRTAGLTNGHLNFTEGARAAIYDYSAGVPRLINMICDRVLVRGYLRRTTTIVEEMVRESVHEVAQGSRGDEDWSQTA